MLDSSWCKFLLIDAGCQHYFQREVIENALTSSENFLRWTLKRRMKPKEIFLIAIRIVGLIETVHWGKNFFHGIARWWNQPESVSAWISLYRLLPALVFLAISLYLIRGAPLLIKFAFPQESARDPSLHQPSNPESTNPVIK